MKQFSDAVVARKLEAWQNYIARGELCVRHVWKTLSLWRSVGLISQAQRDYIMKNLP